MSNRNSVLSLSTMACVFQSGLFGDLGDVRIVAQCLDHCRDPRFFIVAMGVVQRSPILS
ncbi:MAG: hypothetical protein M2R45_03516 [Verrucomicrobia subdivision 3 bacterium]|nr:hypothetical protein [Limisphaerales bacterium]MCS1415913.1 hypothetical protein [Limisphaerales bacterium]